MRKILIMSFVAIALIACKKKNGECDGNYAGIPQDYLNYWFFPTNTYWIYKAQDTNLYDTVKIIRAIVTNHDYNENGKTGDQVVCHTSYEDVLNHSYYNTPSEREEIFAFGSKDNLTPLISYRTKLKSGFPIYLYNEKSTRKDSLQVGNTYFKNVLIFKEPQLVVFASGIGIISIMAEDSLVWELQEYKIGG